MRDGVKIRACPAGYRAAYMYLHTILLPEAVSNNKHRVGINAQLISSNEYRLNSDFGVARVLYMARRVESL
jgi:hypothetical protein